MRVSAHVCMCACAYVHVFVCMCTGYVWREWVLVHIWVWDEVDGCFRGLWSSTKTKQNCVHLGCETRKEPKLNSLGASSTDGSDSGWSWRWRASQMANIQILIKHYIGENDKKRVWKCDQSIRKPTLASRSHCALKLNRKMNLLQLWQAELLHHFDVVVQKLTKK